MARRWTEDDPLAEPIRRREARLVRHVHRRARERLGISMSWIEILTIEARVRARTARFVTRLRGGVSLWDLIVRGRVLRVLFDPRRERLLTVLPDDASTPPPRSCA